MNMFSLSNLNNRLNNYYKCYFGCSVVPIFNDTLLGLGLCLLLTSNISPCMYCREVLLPCYLVPASRFWQRAQSYISSLRLPNNHRRVCMLIVPIII